MHDLEEAEEKITDCYMPLDLSNMIMVVSIV